MSDIPKNNYKTEVHEAADAVAKLQDNPDKDITTQVKQLKAKSAEKVTKLNTMITEAVKNPEMVKPIEDEVNKKFNFQKYQTNITLLEQSLDAEKKKKAVELIDNLTKEFERIDRASLKPVTTAQSSSEPAKPKEKPKSDFDRKKSFITELAKTDTALSASLKEISSTELEKAPYENTVLSTLYKHIKVQDQTKKSQLDSTYNALKKDSQNVGLRLNFLKIIHSIPEKERPGFTDEKMAAAENVWRTRMNKDKGPKGERILPTTQWTMLTSADIQKSPDINLIPAVEKMEVNPQTNTVTDPKTADTSNENPAKTSESTISPLEWNPTNKDKIVENAMKSALEALKSAQSVDFTTGGKLSFKLEGQECVFENNTFTIGNETARFALKGKMLMGEFKDIPIKKLNYKDDKNAALVVDASPLISGDTDHPADLAEAQFKRFLAAAIGKAKKDAAAESEISLDVPVATVKIVFE
ncbi:MAG: hypothetical protein ACK4NC_03245 [Candidatus Gracilibacteria bacterium]